METFGNRLKREREHREMSLAQISQSTKIATRFLRALEEDRFEELPGGIFNRGFVRAYARSLGIDEEQTVADYRSATEAVQPEINEPVPLPAEPVIRFSEDNESPASKRLWQGIAVAILVSLIGWFIWKDHHKRAVDTRVSSAKHSPAEQSPQIAIPPPQPPATTSPVVASSTALPPPKNLPSRESPATGFFVVRVKTREECWISIKADGKQIMKEVLPADSEKSVQASNEVTIKTGNTGGVDFFLNGSKLPAQGGTDEVKTIRFNSGGWVTSASSQAPEAAPQ